MNKVILMGRLTRDPDIRYSQGQDATAIAKFSLAVDRRKNRNSGTTADFFSCTAFGKLAEFAERWLHKGTKVFLTGRIENNNYTNRNGEKVYSMQVIAEELEFAESKKAQEDGEWQDPFPAPAGSQPTDADGFMSIPDDVSDEELPWN